MFQWNLDLWNRPWSANPHGAWQLQEVRWPSLNIRISAVQVCFRSAISTGPGNVCKTKAHVVWFVVCLHSLWTTVDRFLEVVVTMRNDKIRQLHPRKVSLHCWPGCPHARTDLRGCVSNCGWKLKSVAGVQHYIGCQCRGYNQTLFTSRLHPPGLKTWVSDFGLFAVGLPQKAKLALMVDVWCDSCCYTLGFGRHVQGDWACLQQGVRRHGNQKAEGNFATHLSRQVSQGWSLRRDISTASPFFWAHYWTLAWKLSERCMVHTSDSTCLLHSCSTAVTTSPLEQTRLSRSPACWKLQYCKGGIGYAWHKCLPSLLPLSSQFFLHALCWALQRLKASQNSVVSFTPLVVQWFVTISDLRFVIIMLCDKIQGKQTAAVSMDRTHQWM